MKKIAKIVGIFSIILMLVGFVFYSAVHKEIPKGEQGEAADKLASKMLNALEYKAFENTEIIEWTFRGSHHYKWFKQKGIVRVKWGNNTVILNTKDKKNSEVFIDGVNVDSQEFIEKAESYFNNDSFWIVAPYKVFDKGTKRSIVNENGKDLLLVTHTSGGSTPGDSYLWEIDKNGFPIHFKMWVDILPIGGIEATWNNLFQAKSGIFLPKKHTLSLFNFVIPIENINAYNPNADATAKKILDAIRHENYKNTNFLEWGFAGRRHYKWNKYDNIVDVFWDSIQVKLPTKKTTKSTVFINNIKQQKSHKRFIRKAERMFNNDSFWLAAPHKLFDKGTYRFLKDENGTTKLFIKYTTGGSTPGDTYAWSFDENYVPLYYEMYIPSMKINGKKATWEQWTTTKSGTLLPKSHTFENGRVLSMGDVKGYN